MEQREKSTSETVLSKDEYISVLVANACTHKVYQVRMPDFNQCGNLTLELLCQISLACVLTMVGKFELFDGYVVLFVSRFEDVRAGTGADLLLHPDVLNPYSEVFLTALK